MTWEQFERAGKFVAGLIWGTLELWLWGARPAAFLFIGAVWGISEGARAWAKIRDMASQ